MNEIKNTINGVDSGTDIVNNLVVGSVRTKNMFDYGTSTNGGIAVNSTSEKLDYNTHSLTSAWIPCEPNTTYTMSGSYNRSRWQTKAANGTITYVGDNLTSITTSSTAAYLRVYYYFDDNSTVYPTTVTNIQIEKGSTATAFTSYQNLNPNVNGLDNGHFPTYGGFAKRSVRGNQTTYTFSVPNHQNAGFIRNALVMCGDKGFMAIRWAGNNTISPTVAWSSFNSSQVSLTHSNGTLTITFTSTVYGSVDVLFTN